MHTKRVRLNSYYFLFFITLSAMTFLMLAKSALAADSDLYDNRIDVESVSLKRPNPGFGQVSEFAVRGRTPKDCSVYKKL